MSIHDIIEQVHARLMNGTQCTDAQLTLEFAIRLLEHLEHPDLDEAIDILTEISVHNHPVTLCNE